MAKSYNPSSRPLSGLLSDWVAIMAELRNRGFIRSNNNPTGDLAERIVAAHYGVEIASSNERDWDLRTSTGERVQVKGTRVSPGRTPKLGAIRGSMKSFDFVVAVLFEEDFSDAEGLKIPPGVIGKVVRNERINGRQLTITQSLRETPGVESLDFHSALKALGWTKR